VKLSKTINRVYSVLRS